MEAMVIMGLSILLATVCDVPDDIVAIHCSIWVFARIGFLLVYILNIDVARSYLFETSLYAALILICYSIWDVKRVGIFLNSLTPHSFGTTPSELYGNAQEWYGGNGQGAQKDAL